MKFTKKVGCESCPALITVITAYFCLVRNVWTKFRNVRLLSGYYESHKLKGLCDQTKSNIVQVVVNRIRGLLPGMQSKVAKGPFAD